MPRVKRDPSVPVFDFYLNPEKASLSKTTVTMYKNRLNKIAALSYEQKNDAPITSKADILKNPQRVVDLIHAFTPERAQRSVFFAAVFYAIGRQTEDNPLVKAFQSNYYAADVLKKKQELKTLTEEFYDLWDNTDPEVVKKAFAIRDSEASLEEKRTQLKALGR